MPRITIRRADASASASRYIAPVSDGLEYLNFFGFSSTAAGRNLAPGKPGGTVIGAPEFTASLMWMNANKYVRTQVSDSDAVTLMVVAGQDRLASGVYGYPVGTFVQSNVEVGSNLAFLPDAPHQACSVMGRQGTSAVEYDLIGFYPSSAFQFLAVRASSSFATTVDNKTTGARSAAPAPLKARNIGTQPFHVGRCPANSSVLNRDVNMIFVAIYSRVLTDDEVNKVYLGIKPVIARSGWNI